MNHHFEGIADFEQARIDGQREFAERQNAFGLASDVDEQFVFVFLNDRSGEDLALVEDL